jgi:hypothetical protein
VADRIDDLALKDGGARALRWIEDYLARPRRYRVLPDVQPGDIRKRLPATPPPGPE